MKKIILFLAIATGAMLYSVDAKAGVASDLLIRTYCVNGDQGFLQGCNAYWTDRIINDKNKATAADSCLLRCSQAGFLSTACYLKCQKVQENDK
jgi:hypothetical protein